MKRKRKAPPLNIVEEKNQNKNLVDSLLTKKTKVLHENYLTGTTAV